MCCRCRQNIWATAEGHKITCWSKILEKLQRLRLNILTFPSTYILACILHIKNEENIYLKHGDLDHHFIRSQDDLVASYCRLGRWQNRPEHITVKIFNKKLLCKNAEEYVNFIINSELDLNFHLCVYAWINYLGLSNNFVKVKFLFDLFKNHNF